ncbi:Asp23/Gls24 family envelope stress response protein [Caldicellulosiruptor morganii]|uniref:Asp23/Gls24 family envelope stress response protein n=1 Tax=Caldicellulosiruptor morganii TaxID=1387555 RepID=A0ABY7BQ68_9FIRM|nr:Asp23/Gls24 family envelope stress response protein [Caldicellulosiruptor morganii]WAM34709.1 Asp23/Gls24 family envelope stress response protein [Caldicellulosiruptor morganii]
MKVYALIGPSGSGKSHKALIVAKMVGAEAIIDDGILVYNSKLIAGKSAKKEPTYLASVRRALFMEEEHANEVREAIRRLSIKSILILATSKQMAQKIAQRLELEKIERFIDISEVSSEIEIKKAMTTRNKEGKHVVPVPTFEIKKDFSGLLIYPLRLFKRINLNDYIIAEKTIVRPTFSYLGEYTISENVLIAYIKNVLKKERNIAKILSVDLAIKNNLLYIKVELILKFGCNIKSELEKVQKEIKEEIEYYTSINVEYIHLIARGVQV